MSDEIRYRIPRFKVTIVLRYDNEDEGGYYITCDDNKKYHPFGERNRTFTYDTDDINDIVSKFILNELESISIVINYKV